MQIYPTFKAGTCFAVHTPALQNGSFYRATGRKRDDRFARYINGDFMGFEKELPYPNEFTVILPWKEAKNQLPNSML